MYLLTGSSTAAAETALPDATIRIESFDTMAESVGLPNDKFEQESSSRALRPLKIAIFDNGFRGFKSALGRTIPAGTRLRPGPIEIDSKTEELHGLKMAEIFTNLMSRTGVDYQLHLFNTFGYSNFQTATDTVIIEKFDLVIYPHVWEYGGNDDGRGFFNQLVSKVTARGITWVNATGNFGKSTYRGSIERSKNDWAKLPAPNETVRVRCNNSKAGVCNLRAVLAWNSFSDDVQDGTDKDLDLVLTDDTFGEIGTARLAQKKRLITGVRGESLYPREILQAQITPGLYYLRVKIRSQNFSKSDKLRITISGDFTALLDRTEGETLLNPADNSSVITVGAFDSEANGVSRVNIKPDLQAISLIKTEDGELYKGSSNATTAVAARIALELAKHTTTARPHLDRASLLQVVRGGSLRPTHQPAQTSRTIRPNDSRAGSDELAATNPTCYVYSVLPLTTREARAMLRDGGAVVETVSGTKVFIDEDPFDRAARLGIFVVKEAPKPEAAKTDSLILAADLSGFFAAPLSARRQLGRDAFEFVRTPRGASYCPIR